MRTSGLNCLSMIQNKFMLMPLLIGGTLIFLSACGSDDNSEAATTQTPKAVDAVYAQSVEPIFYRDCVSCHVNGGIAPFSLLREENGYTNAVAYKASIKQQIANKLMPPFLASNDGSCQSFQHENALSAIDISDINAWVDSLTVDTVVDVTEPPPSPRTKATIDQPDLVVDMPASFSVSPNVSDDYRCFVIDAKLAQDMLLTGYEVVPGNPGIVHHVILFNLLNPALVPDLEALDNNDPGLGYSCFGDAGFNSTGFVAGWAPGTGATFYPQNTGIKVSANSRLIMQVHYNTANAGGNYDDRTQIKMQLKPIDDPTMTEASMIFHYVSGFQLTAGNNTVSQTVPLSALAAGFQQYLSWPSIPTGFKLYGVFPHMHTYGNKLTASRINSSGNEECLVNVNNWDFEWQRYYSYDSQQTSINLDVATDSLAINCQYNIPALDASGNPLTVKEGPNSGDEMCVNFYYVTPIP